MPLRTVKNGRIKLNHRWWGPENTHKEYDGRLDNQRFLFIQYPETLGYGLVALWGTEEAYRGMGTVNNDEGPECVDDSFPWYFWKPINK